MQSIGNINEVISGVPTMRSGLVFIPPLILSSLVLLYMVLFYKNPPFYPLMVVFGFWCLCAFGVVIGFAVYYAVSNLFNYFFVFLICYCNLTFYFSFKGRYKLLLQKKM